MPERPFDPTVIQDNSASTALVARSFLIDTLIRNVLRDYFAANPFQGYPNVRSLVWRPDVRAGGVTDTPGDIRIDLFDAWNPSRVDSLPSIIVSAGDIASVKLGIGDRHMSPGIVDMTGMQTKTRAWAGSVLVFCLSSLPRQSRLVGLSCAEHLQAFSGQIATRIGLKKFEVAQIKATRPLRELPTVLATPLVVEYGFYDTWHVLPAASPINRIANTKFVNP